MLQNWSQDREGAPHSSGDGWVGYQFWLVVEHGMKAGYVRNIASNPHVRLKLRKGILARWRTGTAQVLPDDDPRKRQRWLTGQLPSSARNAPPCAYSGPNCLRCGLIWTPDSEVDLSKRSSGGI